MSLPRDIAALALAGTAIVALWAARSAAETPGPFTAAQAEAGKTAYLASCQSCHGDNLSGSGEASPLTGRVFMTGWRDRTTKELFDTLKAQMPLNAPGSLDDPTYANLTAFLLRANGAQAGSTALMAGTAVKIGTVASGTTPPEVANGIKPAEQIEVEESKTPRRPGDTIP